MNTRFVLIALLVFSLCAAGCNSADDLLKGFSRSLHKGQLAPFSSLLGKDALEKYGNAEAFARLREKLAPLRLKAGPSTLVDYQCYHNEFLCRDHLVTYEIPVMAAPIAAPTPVYEQINTARIECIEVDHGIAQINENCVFTAFAKEF